MVSTSASRSTTEAPSAGSLGADVAIDADVEDLTGALRAANGGKPVDAVLDMTGGTTTDQSLAALAPFGRLAFYGMASRTPPTPVPPASLLAHSTSISGMWLPHAFRVAGLMPEVLAELFGLVSSGSLRVVAGGEYPLAEARRAHDDLRARRTVGKLVLDPSR